MSVISFTPENFDREISTGKVLVDFHSEHCVHCRRLSPLVEKSSERHSGVKFGKVDVDKAWSLVKKYNILVIPTLIMFSEGEEVKRSVGAVPGEKLDELIKLC